MLLNTSQYADLAIAIALPLLLSQTLILLLHGALLDILTDLCGGLAHARFWLRSAAILAALGSVTLALMFGASSLRGLLIASLLGSFISVAMLSRAVRKRLPQSTNHRGESCAS